MIINSRSNKQKTNKETTIRRSHRMNYSPFIQDFIQVHQSLFQDSRQIDLNTFPIKKAHNIFNINNYIKLFPTPYLLLYQRFCSPYRIFDWIKKLSHNFPAPSVGILSMVRKAFDMLVNCRSPWNTGHFDQQDLGLALYNEGDGDEGPGHGVCRLYRGIVEVLLLPKLAFLVLSYLTYAFISRSQYV